MIERKSFVLAIAGTLARQVASGLLALATVVLVARLLGPEGNGAYAVALLLPGMLATFLNLGVSSANVYYLASRRIDLRTAFAVTFFISGLCSLVGLVVGGVICVFLRDALFPGIALEALLLALASFPFVLCLQAAGGLMQGLQDFRAFNLTLLAPPLVTLVGVCALAILGRFDLTGVIACYLCGQVVGVVVTTTLLVRRPSWATVAPTRKRRHYLSEVLGYGLKAYASNVVTFFNYRTDLFLVNFFLGPSAAGIYVMAMQFGEKLWLFSQAVSTVFLPKVSELAHNDVERQRLTPRIAQWTFLLTLAAALLLALVSGPLLTFLVGPDFSEATWVLLLLLPGIVAWAPARILANDIAGRGKPEINLRIAILVMVVNLLGNLILIPIIGLTGAAMATVISYCLMLLLTSVFYRKSAL